jgi:hypothetical protein
MICHGLWISSFTAVFVLVQATSLIGVEQAITSIGLQVWEVARRNWNTVLACARINVAPGIQAPAISRTFTSWISGLVPSLAE